jgi:hypothetical protein
MVVSDKRVFFCLPVGVLKGGIFVLSSRELRGGTLLSNYVCDCDIMI